MKKHTAGIRWERDCTTSALLETWREPTQKSSIEGISSENLHHEELGVVYPELLLSTFRNRFGKIGHFYLLVRKGIAGRQTLTVQKEGGV